MPAVEGAVVGLEVEPDRDLVKPGAEVRLGSPERPGGARDLAGGMSFAGSKTSSTTTYRGSAVKAKSWIDFCSNVSVFFPPALFSSTRAPAEPTTNFSGTVIATR